ncbi:MAG: outer membrane lipoprotein carrier protein LolA [Ignavibacteriaceae bacterium]|nr:outer membrane lipoprotein carrier protein LolA [Ignavibacteriaceae bacterium]
MRSILKTLCMILVFIFSAAAQDKGKDFLENVQKKYKSTNDISADFKQSISEKVVQTGKIFYSNGNKLRLELKNSTIISDGAMIWNYNRSQKKVIINNVSNSDPSFFSIDQLLYDYPSKSNITSENENNNILLIPHKESELNFKKARIWVNNDFLIMRISIENLSGSIINLLFSNYKLNQNLPASKFTFSPPEGTNIIDLRK